jgi:hypothetical protein
VLTGGGYTIYFTPSTSGAGSASLFNTANTPTFSPAAGSYSSAQTVTISTTTPGATIYYTTDGSAPTTSSSVYSSPITVSTSEMVEAIAAAAGYSNSSAGSAVYSITAISSLNPSSANTGSVVTISGVGFGATEGQSTVTFNGVAAGVFNWSDSSITAVVPGNATTGLVVIELANGQTSNNSVNFTVSSLSCNW